MSLKIYTGFKLKTNDMLELHRELMKFRDELGVEVEKKQINYFARECSILLDAVAVGARKLKKTDSIISIVYHKHFDKMEEVNKKDIRHPDVDFSFSLSILPTENDELVGIVYTEQQEFLDKWFEKPFVEEYMYWNNTDAPDHVTEEDWKARGDVWSKVLEPFNGIPAMLGFNVDCVPKYIGPPQIPDIVSNFPSFEDRASRIAEDVLFEEMHRKETLDANTAVRIYTNFMKWLGSDEGRLVKAKKQGVIEAKLKKEVTVEDIS